MYFDNWKVKGRALKDGENYCVVGWLYKMDTGNEPESNADKDFYSEDIYEHVDKMPFAQSLAAVLAAKYPDIVNSGRASSILFRVNDDTDITVNDFKAIEKSLIEHEEIL